MKLSYYEEVVIRKEHGLTTQRLTTTAEYSPEDGVDVNEVKVVVKEANKAQLDITKLLDKTSLLIAHIESIDWDEIYRSGNVEYEMMDE